MNFIHVADFHFDSPFLNLSDKDGLGEICRMEQREVLKKIIDYIQENEIENLFISGDLYEQKYIKKTTIEYINNQFKRIPNTKIYIAPGNHDPYIKNSYYNKFEWSENVKIFGAQIERVETPEVDIYGYGFDDFYCESSGVEDIEIQNPEKVNILVVHGDLDASITQKKLYNPISNKKLKEKGFDYVALGHIHKPSYDENIVYPGSAFPLGFDELGQRGMIVGKISEGQLNKQFVKLNGITFSQKVVDVTDIISKEELAEKINEIPTEQKELVSLQLQGKRNFEIDIYDLYKIISNEKIIKMKDETRINYNLEKIADETTLKGIYVKNLVKKLENEQDENERQIIENAIEIGLEILE